MYTAAIVVLILGITHGVPTELVQFQYDATNAFSMACEFTVSSSNDLVAVNGGHVFCVLDGVYYITQQSSTWANVVLKAHPNATNVTIASVNAGVPAFLCNSCTNVHIRGIFFGGNVVFYSSNNISITNCSIYKSTYYYLNNVDTLLLFGDTNMTFIEDVVVVGTAPGLMQFYEPYNDAIHLLRRVVLLLPWLNTTSTMQLSANYNTAKFSRIFHENVVFITLPLQVCNFNVLNLQKSFQL